MGGTVLVLQLDGQGNSHATQFEHDHGAHGSAHRDHNIRAAYIHVLADAAVSVLAVIGLSLAKFLGWTFMDPIMGMVGMAIILNWSYGLIRDTGGILLDMTPGPAAGRGDQAHSQKLERTPRFRPSFVALGTGPPRRYH